MCYSARIAADFRKYTQVFGADIDIEEFFRVFWLRHEGAALKIPRGMERPFVDVHSGDEARIQQLIEAYRNGEAQAIEQDLFKQRARLVTAERDLESKTTKAATESKRIATDKIARGTARLADLRRETPKDRDSRIFPGQYAPVMVVENGRRIVKPMRYQCRPAGKPAFYDKKYPGTYNARRDNLEGFWRSLFGYSHGIMIVNVFYENVSRHRLERRDLRDGEKEENVVLEFTPNPDQDMYVACLWSHWTGNGQPDLLSFAAVTDDPPPEIAIAGHDRCIVPIKPENIDAWLNPDPAHLADSYKLLDDRQQPYYEYQQAA